MRDRNGMIEEEAPVDDISEEVVKEEMPAYGVPDEAVKDEAPVDDISDEPTKEVIPDFDIPYEPAKEETAVDDILNEPAKAEIPVDNILNEPPSNTHNMRAPDVHNQLNVATARIATPFVAGTLSTQMTDWAKYAAFGGKGQSRDSTTPDASNGQSILLGLRPITGLGSALYGT